MVKLKFNYLTMNAGKSIDLVRIAYIMRKMVLKF